MPLFGQRLDPHQIEFGFWVPPYISSAIMNAELQVTLFRCFNKKWLACPTVPRYCTIITLVSTHAGSNIEAVGCNLRLVPIPLSLRSSMKDIPARSEDGINRIYTHSIIPHLLLHFQPAQRPDTSSSIYQFITNDKAVYAAATFMVRSMSELPAAPLKLALATAQHQPRKGYGNSHAPPRRPL